MTNSALLVRAAAAILIAWVVWVGWPLYGFVSNQFEVARLPWGWQSLPAEMPRDDFIAEPALAEAGAAAVGLLEKRRAEIDAPSISAAVSINGELVWATAIGWGDVANRIPVTTQTAYRIGSTSKAVGITALARLTVADVIDLNSQLSTYADDLPNPEWEKFTPLQLASHTAGLAAYEENNDWLGFYQSLALTTRFETPKDALSVFDSADLLFEPGEEFHYSGFDNVLLSAVMQDAADRPFDDVMTDYVFRPLGLEKTQPDHLRSTTLPFAVS